MKRKTGICLMLALLMIISTFSVTSSVTINDDHPGIVYFDKTVKDPETGEWINEITTIIGETLQFKITITYNMNDFYNNDPISLYDIRIVDELPYYLEYVDGSANIEPTGISGQTIFWNFTKSELELHDGESLSMEFEAVVVDISTSEEYKNKAYFTAVECGMYDHSDHDCARVYVRDEIVVKKEIYNGEEWVKTLDSVILNQTIKFRITITYYGPYALDWMKITENLSNCCLEYKDNVILNGLPKTYNETIIDGDVTWEWKQGLEITNDETVSIVFDTRVVSYHCDCEHVCNDVNVMAKDRSCVGKLYEGDDTVCFYCGPPPPTFEKKVWDNKEGWTEQTSVYVDDIVSFKISLTHYGEEPLQNIEIVDQLPCCLEYANKASRTIIHDGIGPKIVNYEGDVSEDKRTITWDNENISLTDGDVLSIQFNALVVDITSPCGCHGINTATCTACNYEQNDYSGIDTANITSTHKPPAPPAKITISIKSFSLGHIQANIKNVGESGVSFVKWSMTVKGGILKKINAKAGGTLSGIDVVGYRSISSGKRSIKHGFGRITITITVTVGEKTFEKKANGFVIGRSVIVRQ